MKFFINLTKQKQKKKSFIFVKHHIIISFLDGYLIKLLSVKEIHII